MAPDPTLGKRIKRARERMGLTQRELAGFVGRDRKTVDNWENGRTTPRSSIGALEAVLGISLEGAEPDPKEEELRDMGIDRGGFLTTAEVEHNIARYRAVKQDRLRERAG